ncbi:MAG TPA: hypothetical protein VNZ53_44655 [Steroidobacteraceae bacterium]|jgi:hypothetical protein|nr:hypothetical protein [Steroidobacteraceae bacterium]
MRRIVPVLVLASMGSLGATAVLADVCHGPSAPANFPEASTATEQDILSAQQSVKRYLSEMESAIKCMDAQHNEQAHNDAVDDMQKTATKFNSLLRAYRARQKA